jgi:hypothetical protein
MNARDPNSSVRPIVLIVESDVLTGFPPCDTGPSVSIAGELAARI